jgi:hypothetical protein
MMKRYKIDAQVGAQDTNITTSTDMRIDHARTLRTRVRLVLKAYDRAAPSRCAAAPSPKLQLDAMQCDSDAMI